MSKLDRKEEERLKTGTGALVRRPSGVPREAPSNFLSQGRSTRHDASEVKQRARSREGGTGNADRRAMPRDTRENEASSHRRVVRRDDEEGTTRRVVSSASARQQHHRQQPPAMKHGGLMTAPDKPRETQHKRKREDANAGATTAAAADDQRGGGGHGSQSGEQPGGEGNSAVRRRVVTGSSRRPVTTGASAQSESSDHHHHLPTRAAPSAPRQPSAGPVRQQSTDQDWQMAAMAMARIDVKQQQSRPAGSGKAAPPRFNSRGNASGQAGRAWQRR